MPTSPHSLPFKQNNSRDDKGWTIDEFGTDKEKITEKQTVDKERENGSSPHRWSLHHPLSLSPSVSVSDRGQSAGQSSGQSGERDREQRGWGGGGRGSPPPHSPLVPRMLCNCCKQAGRVSDSHTFGLLPFWGPLLTLCTNWHPTTTCSLMHGGCDLHHPRFNPTLVCEHFGWQSITLGIFINQMCTVFLRIWICYFNVVLSPVNHSTAARVSWMWKSGSRRG